MNITIITNVFPYPLNSGGAQAQFNMVDMLRKKHNISIIFTEDSSNRMSAMRSLSKLWPEVKFFPFRYVRQMCYPLFFKDKAIRAFKLKFKYDDPRFQVERALKPHGVYFSKDFRTFVNRVVSGTKTDIVQVEFFPCLGAVECLASNVKKIFIHHEIRFVRNRRLLGNINLTQREHEKELAVKELEIRRLNMYDAVVTLTETDKDILERNGVIVPIFVSPAAVNTKKIPYKAWNGKMLFIGGYGHLPNKEGIDWFISRVMENLDKSVPLQIVGAGWPLSYERENDNVKLLGFVERLEDIAPGSIMIVPILTGSGMRMKILEAAAMNIPFVTTSVGVEGLDFKNEESCLVADTPEDFAKALKRLFIDEDLREFIAHNASALWERKYSVKALSEVRDDIYTNIMERNSMSVM